MSDENEPVEQAQDIGILAAIRAVGSQSRLAEVMQVTPPAITKFLRSGCPAGRVLQMEAATGVPRGVLRPDLYPVEQGG